MSVINTGHVGSTTQSQNPFVHIPNSARLIVAIYFLGWRFLPEMARSLQYDAPDTNVLFFLTLVRVSYDLLLLLPFLLYRFAGTPIGWVHPLILPTVISIASGFAKNPNELMTVIAAWITRPETPQYLFLEGLSVADAFALELKSDYFRLLAHIFYLAGFFIFFKKYPASLIKPSLPLSGVRLSIVAGLIFVLFLYFIQGSGGLIAHFSSLAYGRFRAAAGSGHLLVAIKFLPFMMVLWYLNKPSVMQAWWFRALFFFSLLIQYAMSGSRSSMILPVIIMLAAWIVVNRKPPARAAVITVLAFLLGFGVLGELRRSSAGNEGVADFSVLTDFDLQLAYSKSIEEVTSRQQSSGYIAVMHAVPARVDHLHGITYVSALAFFVPRTIWPEKPRGAGAHVRAMIFGGMDSADGYEGGGIPPGAVGEAYWNFGIPGVILIFSLFGAFHRYVADIFARNPRDPRVAVFLLLSLIVLGSPTSISIVDYLQSLILLFMVSKFCGIKNASAQSSTGQSRYGPGESRGNLVDINK